MCPWCGEDCFFWKLYREYKEEDDLSSYDF